MRKFKFKLYRIYYGDGSVSFTFKTLREVKKWDRLMQNNEIRRIVGFTNALDGYVGQIVPTKRSWTVVF